MGAEESRRYGSVGRIVANLEAKIVDPTSGQVLGPGEQGELWIRGPTIMKGKSFYIFVDIFEENKTQFIMTLMGVVRS